MQDRQYKQSVHFFIIVSLLSLTQVTESVCSVFSATLFLFIFLFILFFGLNWRLTEVSMLEEDLQRTKI